MDRETKICQGKDVFERMNFLYQASQSIASKDVFLSSYYGDIMTRCSKKAVLRVEPEVKRTICKHCQTPLIPGRTARVRLISKPEKLVKWHCLICNSTKKYPTKNGYEKWWDDSKAVIQLFDYTPKSSKKKDVASDKKEDTIKPVHHDKEESTKYNVSVSLN